MRTEDPSIGRFVVDAAYRQYLRMKPSGSFGPDGSIKLTVAGDEADLGELDLITYANNDAATLYDGRADGTHCYVSSNAIAIGDWVSTAAAGKVQTGTGGAVIKGRALSATSGDGEHVEVMPIDMATTLGRSAIVQQDLVAFPIPLSYLRVWDAPHTNAVGTPANDDLGIVYNTFGTAGPSVETGDLKNAGATSRKIGFQIVVPECYVAGETATMRLNAGMKTTVASVSATIDLEVTRAAAPTVDICATPATTINSLTAANKDFTLTPTNLVPGEILDCVVTIAVNDSGTGTAVIGKWYQGVSALLLDIKG